MTEPRWLKWVSGLILVGSIVAVGLTLWNLTVSLESQRLAVSRAEETLSELETIAARLDVQADTFEANAEATRQSRAQFEEVARLLLEALEVDAEPFATAPAPAPADDSSGGGDGDTEPEPEPESSPEPGNSGGNRNQPKKPKP